MQLLSSALQLLKMLFACAQFLFTVFLFCLNGLRIVCKLACVGFPWFLFSSIASLLILTRYLKLRRPPPKVVDDVLGEQIDGVNFKEYADVWPVANRGASLDALENSATAVKKVCSKFLTILCCAEVWMLFCGFAVCCPEMPSYFAGCGDKQMRWAHHIPQCDAGTDLEKGQWDGRHQTNIVDDPGGNQEIGHHRESSTGVSSSSSHCVLNFVLMFVIFIFAERNMPRRKYSHSASSSRSYRPKEICPYSCWSHHAITLSLRSSSN